MNCIELSDNPFQGVWIVWFAMLMLAAGCDSIRRRRHHCRSKWAESARTPRCTRCTRCNLCRIVTHCASLCHVVPSLCHVVPCCAIGIHWVFPRAGLRLLLRCSSEDFLNQCIRRDPAERLSATDPWQLNPKRISLIFFAEN